MYDFKRSAEVRRQDCDLGGPGRFSHGPAYTRRSNVINYGPGLVKTPLPTAERACRIAGALSVATSICGTFPAYRQSQGITLPELSRAAKTKAVVEACRLQVTTINHQPVNSLRKVDLETLPIRAGAIVMQAFRASSSLSAADNLVMRVMARAFGWFRLEMCRAMGKRKWSWHSIS